jgi:hypothetical protein
MKIFLFLLRTVYGLLLLGFEGDTFSWSGGLLRLVGRILILARLQARWLLIYASGVLRSGLVRRGRVLRLLLRGRLQLRCWFGRGGDWSLRLGAAFQTSTAIEAFPSAAAATLVRDVRVRYGGLRKHKSRATEPADERESRFVRPVGEAPHSTKKCHPRTPEAKARTQCGAEKERSSFTINDRAESNTDIFTIDVHTEGYYWRPHRRAVYAEASVEI